MPTDYEIPQKLAAHGVDILHPSQVGAATLAEAKVGVDDLLYAPAVERCQLPLLHCASFVHYLCSFF